MPNPSGINQYAEKKHKFSCDSHFNPALISNISAPSDDVLQAALLRYRKQDQRHEDQLLSLRKEFGYDIGLTSWKKLVKRLKIPTVRTQKLPLTTVAQAVVDEVEKDPIQAQGPDFIKDQLRLKMILAPRDGHEKIAPSALHMGGVGFSIYGFKDKFSDFLLFLRIYPDVRSRGAGGHIFLDFVQETGYIPIQLTTDKGSEVGWLYAFMSTLREIYAADIDIDLYPFHVLIKSIHNTVIEGFWRQLKEKLGLNLKDFLLRGKVELDNFKLWRNHHRVRHQHEKILPSGHVPAHALEFPELFGALDCRIAIPQEAIDDLRQQLTEEEGSKKDYQTWPGLTPDFNVYATDVYSRIMGQLEGKVSHNTLLWEKIVYLKKGRRDIGNRDHQSGNRKPKSKRDCLAYRTHTGRAEVAHGQWLDADSALTEKTASARSTQYSSDTSGSDESFKLVGGGSTRFWGEEIDHYADVEALSWRVLVPQHDNLLHTGEKVKAGVKCTMWSKILYEKVGGPVPVIFHHLHTMQMLNQLWESCYWKREHKGQLEKTTDEKTVTPWSPNIGRTPGSRLNAAFNQPPCMRSLRAASAIAIESCACVERTVGQTVYCGITLMFP
ncbi:hypothetical protein DFH08DRAFT_826880 [Mycena albidolilacea]|uniref:Uncharacterized protein n=1 Tax=Mycena albidolilacea TaxID=1033008 RepID=A0AAD7E7Q1_9AGAR|nr:hypothetical protein DFH08DRAFT_826880 [Mycena albidolilacea]